MFSNTKTTKAMMAVMMAAIGALIVIVILMGQRLNRAEYHISQSGKLLLQLHDNSETLAGVSEEHGKSIQEIYRILESVK